MIRTMVTNEIVAKYPQLFEKCFDFSIGKGWYPLVENLCDQINKLDPTINILQIKEKFGSLRFYASKIRNRNNKDKIHELIEEAEKLSKTICEDCGSTEEVTTDGDSWVLTLCKHCKRKREIKRL